MKLQKQDRLFLAKQRESKETAQYKRQCTFNFESVQDSNKTAVAQLYALNDDTLMGGQKTTFEIGKDSYLIIIPITGAVNYLDDAGNETDIDVEETIVVFVEKGTHVILSNPFENDMVNYLCLFLDEAEFSPNNPQYFNFDLSNPNQLIKIESNALPFNLHIGRFDGGKEAKHSPSKNSCFYTFVITGTFEVDGRLLHEKDSLALWGTNEIKLEALCNHAVIVTLEMPEKNKIS